MRPPARRFPAILILLLAFLAACGPSPVPSPTPTPWPTIPPTATPVPSPTPLPGITQTRAVDHMVLVYVPAGEFLMGSSEADVVDVLQSCADCQRDWFTDELPPHEVYVNAFWLDRTEVSNAQFAIFLSHRGNQVEGGVPWLDLASPQAQIEAVGDLFQPREGYAAHPVTGVSWYGATAYCRWVGGQLPSEAQWEYAARGPAGLIYPWGNQFECGWGNFADGCDDGYAASAPVGSFAQGASWCRALDLAGNAWEWVADWYARDYYSDSPDQNPQGADSGEDKVMRGGSWRSPSAFARTTVRNHIFPAYTFDEGFRCARAP